MSTMAKKDMVDTLSNIIQTIERHNNIPITNVTRDYLIQELHNVRSAIVNSRFGNRIDYTGKKFGKLTVLRQIDKVAYSNCAGYELVWECQCDCGNLVNKRSSTLSRFMKGTVTEPMCPRCRIKITNTTHGMAGTDLYNSWCGMKQRCYDPNFPGYKGNRVVCDEWLNDFEAFAVWSYKHGYVDGAKWIKLKRIDTNKDFTPDNCKWTTVRMIEYNGEVHTLKEWSDITGVSVATIHDRLKRGLQPQHIFHKGRLKLK